jgi:bifunctional DNase/RNase
MSLYHEIITHFEKLRVFENDMSLPKGSIRNDHERELFLKYGDIIKTNKTYNEIAAITQKSPFTFDCVFNVFRRLDTIDDLDKVITFSCQSHIDPNVIVDTILLHTK